MPTPPGDNELLIGIPGTLPSPDANTRPSPRPCQSRTSARVLPTQDALHTRRQTPAEGHHHTAGRLPPLAFMADAGCCDIALYTRTHMLHQPTTPQNTHLAGRQPVPDRAPRQQEPCVHTSCSAATGSVCSAAAGSVCSTAHASRRHTNMSTPWAARGNPHAPHTQVQQQVSHQRGAPDQAS